MLYYCEIEFVNSQGQIETRSFSRATSVAFGHDRIEVKEGESRFFLRGNGRINYFESGTLSSRLSEQDRDTLLSEVKTLCGEGKRIAAIKLARDVLGYGLRDAKEYVDQNFPPRPCPPKITRDCQAVEYDDNIPY